MKTTFYWIDQDGKEVNRAEFDSNNLPPVPMKHTLFSFGGKEYEYGDATSKGNEFTLNIIERRPVTMELGKFYKSKLYHSFIKVQAFENGIFSGIGFYINEAGYIGFGDASATQPDQYNEITEEEFRAELGKTQVLFIENLSK